jgi:hypothetical protein
LLTAATLATGFSCSWPVVERAFPPALAQDSVSVSVEFRTALEPYGRWQHHARWGDVWIPDNRPRDWRPYTVGHWAYTEEWGWYWVADQEEDAWGWVVFHYGHWVLDAELGWIWVPGDEWGPGWVQWRRGTQYVGWAPLPPDERIAVEYRARPEVWVFVRIQDFTSPQIAEVVLPPREYDVYIRETVVENRTVELREAHLAVNPGIPPTFIAAAVGRPIRSYEVRPRVLAGTVHIDGAIEVRAEELRQRTDRQAFREELRESQREFRPAGRIPPPQPLANDERGRLGDIPPRAAARFGQGELRQQPTQPPTQLPNQPPTQRQGQGQQPGTQRRATSTQGTSPQGTQGPGSSTRDRQGQGTQPQGGASQDRRQVPMTQGLAPRNQRQQPGGQGLGQRGQPQEHAAQDQQHQPQGTQGLGGGARDRQRQGQETPLPQGGPSQDRLQPPVTEGLAPGDQRQHPGAQGLGQRGQPQEHATQDQQRQPQGTQQRRPQGTQGLGGSARERQRQGQATQQPQSGPSQDRLQPPVTQGLAPRDQPRQPSLPNLGRRDQSAQPQDRGAQDRQRQLPSTQGLGQREQPQARGVPEPQHQPPSTQGLAPRDLRHEGGAPRQPGSPSLPGGRTQREPVPQIRTPQENREPSSTQGLGARPEREILPQTKVPQEPPRTEGRAGPAIGGRVAPPGPRRPGEPGRRLDGRQFVPPWHVD